MGGRRLATAVAVLAPLGLQCVVQTRLLLVLLLKLRCQKLATGTLVVIVVYDGLLACVRSEVG